MVIGLLPKSIVEIVSNITMKNVYMPLVDHNEIEPKYEMAWNELRKHDVVLGDYLEFGVSRGHSMASMHRVIRKLKLDHVRLFGFDSFEGMPSSAAEEDYGTWKPGQFASAIEETKEFLTKFKVNWEKTHLIKGWFSDTLNDQTAQNFGIQKASVIMIDCDIYSASKTALDFCLPFITDNAIVFFDDWRDDITFGEYKAYTEFLDENRHLRSDSLGAYEPTGRIFLVTNLRVKR